MFLVRWGGGDILAFILSMVRERPNEYLRRRRMDLKSLNIHVRRQLLLAVFKVVFY